ALPISRARRSLRGVGIPGRPAGSGTGPACGRRAAESRGRRRGPAERSRGPPAAAPAPKRRSDPPAPARGERSKPARRAAPGQGGGPPSAAAHRPPERREPRGVTSASPGPARAGGAAETPARGAAAEGPPPRRARWAAGPVQCGAQDVRPCRDPVGRQRRSCTVGDAEGIGLWAASAPVVGAPMAGGASTPELVAAVGAAGGTGFLAGGYATPEALAEQIARTRGLTGRPFGVNLFVPGPDDADPDAVAAYARTIAPEADALLAPLGEPRRSDDAYPAKLDLLRSDPVPVVSFTFGVPAPADASALRAAGSAIAATVSTLDEARAAVEAGADALVVQGAEAGGHQGSFDDAEERTAPLLDLLAEVRAEVRLPLIAAGGIGDAAAVRKVLAHGAAAAQVGTALLRSPESGASDTHKQALADEVFPG